MSSADSQLHVVTCNVRYNNPADGLNAWPYRRDALVAELLRLNPDILATQEVRSEEFDQLRIALPGYTALGVGRDDGVREGEFAAIFYRTWRFDLLNSDTFWLSDTPSLIGSLGWDAMITRICTWAKLHDRIANRNLLTANVHLDHVGVTARVESGKLLASKLPTLVAAGEPIILSGDFNSFEDSDAYQSLIDSNVFIDSYRVAHPTRTENEASFNGYGETDHRTRIDWIFTSNNLRTVSAEIHRTRRKNGGFLSDHYPVSAILEYCSN